MGRRAVQGLFLNAILLVSDTLIGSENGVEGGVLNPASSSLSLWGRFSSRRMRMDHDGGNWFSQEDGIGRACEEYFQAMLPSRSPAATQRSWSFTLRKA